MTKEGLLKREWMFYRYINKAGIPIAITMTGGYTKKMKDAIDIQ